VTAPWWGKEASPAERLHPAPSQAAPAAWPELVTATRNAVFNEVSGRILSYTPEWTNQGPGDAGVALARLFPKRWSQCCNG
jgi:hypothetical protein